MLCLSVVLFLPEITSMFFEVQVQISITTEESWGIVLEDYLIIFLRMAGPIFMLISILPR